MTISFTDSRSSRPRVAFVSLSLAMLLASLGTSIANVGLPTLVQAFHATFQQVQWVVLAYLLAVTSLIVSAGRLADVVGRRRLLLVGISLFTVACALCAVAPTLLLLIAARALQGLGAAIMMVLSLAMLGDIVPKAKTGSAMGLLGSMSAIGTALGPTLGGTLIAGFGWPALFLVNLPLGVLTFFFAYRYFPRDGEVPWTGLASFDLMGTLLLTLTLVAFALALTMGRGNFGQLNILLLLAAGVGAVLFVIVEANAASPLIQLATFQNSRLSSGLAMSTLVTTVVMATLVVGPFYLAGALALDAARVGLVMSTGPIVAALAGAPAGRFVDRFGTYRMTVTGLIVMAIGCVMLPVLSPLFGVPGYIAPLVLITTGYALFQAANNTAVMTTSQSKQRGYLSGMLNLSRNLGLILGASLMGAIFSFGVSTAGFMFAQPQAVVSGMQTTFFVAAAFVIAALVIAVASALLSRKLKDRHA